MPGVDNHNPVLVEMTCRSLMFQLQELWDEVGETEKERDKMLPQLEQEDVNVHKREVKYATKSREQLLQALADATRELSTLYASLGEKSIVNITLGTIKEQLAAMPLALGQLWKKKKADMIKKFLNVQKQKNVREIEGDNEHEGRVVVDKFDTCLKNLDEDHDYIQSLKEKSQRLNINDFLTIVHDICSAFGIDFHSTISDAHSSLNNEATIVPSKSISIEMLARVKRTLIALIEAKKQSLQEFFQELATKLTELPESVDSSKEERSLSDYVTTSADEVTLAGALSLDPIEQVEFQSLDQFKASRMKEIASKTQRGLEKLSGFIRCGNLELPELPADMDVPECNMIMDMQKLLTLDIDYEDWLYKVGSVNPQSQVSNDMIRKILVTCSTPDLRRFRFEKPLHRIICDPFFSKCRSQRSILLIVTGGFFRLSVDGLDVTLEREASPLNTKVEAFGRYHVYVIGEVDGIVLMEYKENEDCVRVYNPATEETSVLPDLPYECVDSRYIINEGMVYDKGRKDYLYLVITGCKSRDGDQLLKLYSLKEKHWVFEKKGMSLTNFGMHKRGFFFNDSLYWLLGKDVRYFDGRDVVVSTENSITRLSVGSYEFSVQKFPTENERWAACLGTIESNLCMVTIGGNNLVNVWRMGDEEWSIFRSYQVSIHSNTAIEVVCILNDGKLICRSSHGLVCYNPDTMNSAKIIDLDWEEDNSYSAIEYMECFEDLPSRKLGMTLLARAP